MSDKLISFILIIIAVFIGTSIRIMLTYKESFFDNITEKKKEIFIIGILLLIIVIGAIIVSIFN